MRFENRLLSSLEPADLEALAGHIEMRDVAKGQVLIEQDGDIDQVHFPETAALSNLIVFSDGRAVETSVVAREGVSGLAPFLADIPCGWRVEVQRAGRIGVMPAARLRQRSKESEPLLTRLTLLSYDYQAQAAQTAACNAIHPANQRLARWLLTLFDRSDDQEIQFTQQDVADILGAQRTTMTEAATQLKTAGGIAYSRGRIRLTDRGVLERQACECYRMQAERTRRMGLLV